MPYVFWSIKLYTCEFRHHGGVEEIKEAEAWVRLILQLCQKVQSAVPEQFRLLVARNSNAQ